MDKQELINKIELLRQAAEQMDEPNRTFNLDDVSQLRIQFESMAISDIAEKMRSIYLPEIAEMNKNIQAANNATTNQSQRVEAFNNAYNFIKRAIGLVV